MKILTSCLALTLLTYTSISSAEDKRDEMSEYGDSLHQDHCYKCHGDEVYKRDDRFVKTIEALGKQVRRCRDNLGVTWFDEDTDSVIHFLNKKYYKF